MKKLIIFLFLISSCGLLNAQDNEDKYIIFEVPQYLLTNGLRIDFDIRESNFNKWWTISPYYYAGDSGNDVMGNNDGYDSYEGARSFDKMYGFGLGVERRTMLTAKTKNEGFYFKYGANYKYFLLSGNNYAYRDVIGDDGLTYQKLQEGDYTINISSISGIAAIGYQFILMPKLYLDTYAGFGVKYSIHNSADNVKTKFNRSSIDYGYTGTLFIGGVRLGIAL